MLSARLATAAVAIPFLLWLIFFAPFPVYRGVVLLFTLVALEGRNLFAAAAFSLGISLSTYVLFTVALKTPLEQGLFGF